MAELDVTELDMVTEIKMFTELEMVTELDTAELDMAPEEHI